ncbi:MAG: hypothetical protein WBW81_05960 [Methylocella sp.]
MNDTLHIMTAVSNPLRWKSRIALARAAVAGWLSEPNVHVTVAEVAHGARSHDLTGLGEHPRDACSVARGDSLLVEGKLPEHRRFPAPA